MASAWTRSRGSFDLARKQERLAEIEAQSQNPDLWNNSGDAKKLLKERATCEEVVAAFKRLDELCGEAATAFELARDTGDPEFATECMRTFGLLEVEVDKLEFRRKMIGAYDRNHAIVEVNAGAGGTEAQDWAEMLTRMYVRWAERRGFKVQTLDYQPGEGAGIKSATLYIEGEYAFGFLRSETGVHRLVRISPFDANARRHTSFAAVGVTPDAEEESDIEVPDKDLKIDTYRASGAGGQHVNRTDSAVRFTHLPTGIVVTCQNERSQHKNRAMAMKILKSKLAELQREEQEKRLDSVRGERKKIEWGSQIRSYVLQPYQLIKDLRTDYETSNVDKVLDGELDPFLEAYLLSAENKKAGGPGE